MNYSAKAQAYINYINDLKQFSNMPRWKRELATYNNKPAKKVSLSPSTMDDAHKAINSLPLPRFYKVSPILRNSGHLLIVRDYI